MTLPKPYYQDSAVTLYHGLDTLRPVINRNRNELFKIDSCPKMQAQEKGRARSFYANGRSEGLQADGRTCGEAQETGRKTSQLEGRVHYSEVGQNAGASLISGNRPLHILRGNEIGAASQGRKHGKQ